MDNLYILNEINHKIGIGLALANDLAQKGWKLAIVDLNATQGEALVAGLGQENALFIKADVSDWEENVKFFKLIKEKFGRVDFGTTLAPPVQVHISSCRQCGNR